MTSELHHHESHRPGHGHGHGHAHVADDDAAAMAELLDLDAEVLGDYLGEVLDAVGDLAGDPPRRILDVGCGSGAGTLALARRFPAARVTALDMSAPLLRHLRGRAHDLGVADRIDTVEVDLDAQWPALGPADLAWASNSLHHMADPGHALREIFAAVRPGGLLAVAEVDAFPRFLPEDVGIGRPGLEARCHAVMDAARAAAMPHFGDDWGPRLTAAGFALRAERRIAADLTPPLPDATGRYARAALRRMRTGLVGRLSDDDLTTLDTLVDSDGPDGVLRGDDLSVRAARTVWVAVRP